jgi:allophanate hydrolase
VGFDRESVPRLPAALTIEALHTSYAAGLEPWEVISEVYRRIASAHDPGIFIALSPEAETLAAACALCPFDRQAKPLWGVPFAIKDNIDLAGLPTTAGCPEFAYRPAASAPAVARLVAAGAIPIGKTNLDQFATGLVGTRTSYGVPRNPFDPAIVPGGSSSGSAVAVSRGIVPFALGTDTAGSGRVPAGLNNIVGLKPTKGAISTRGVVPACRTLDCVSVFALTVGDAVTVYRAMAGFDPEDPYSRPVTPHGRSVARIAGLRVGVPNFASRMFRGDEFARNAFDASVEDLAALGVPLAKIDLAPFLAAGELLYEGPWVAERYHAVGDFIERCPDAVHPVVRQIILAAARLSAVDAFAGLYRLAELRRSAEATWESLDVLLVPTSPRPRRVVDIDSDPIGSNSEFGTYTNFVNLLDLCALAVPGRFRSDGLPSGVTLIAPARCDDRIAAIGAALHAQGAVPLGHRLS